MAASAALVLGEGRGLVDHTYEEECRAGDDTRALACHVLKERIVQERGLALGQHALEDLEVPKDRPQRLDPDLVQGDFRHLGRGRADLLVEFLLPLLRGFDLAPEFRELALRVLELAALVVEFGEDLVEFLLQGLLLRPEVGPAVRAKALVGQGLPDGVDLLLDTTPRRLQVGDHSGEALHAFCRLGDLPFKAFEGGILAVHLLLECTALP